MVHTTWYVFFSFLQIRHDTMVRSAVFMARWHDYFQFVSGLFLNPALSPASSIGGFFLFCFFRVRGSTETTRASSALVSFDFLRMISRSRRLLICWCMPEPSLVLCMPLENLPTSVVLLTPRRASLSFFNQCTQKQVAPLDY